MIANVPLLLMTYYHIYIVVFTRIFPIHIYIFISYLYSSSYSLLLHLIILMNFLGMNYLKVTNVWAANTVAKKEKSSLNRFQLNLQWQHFHAYNWRIYINMNIKININISIKHEHDQADNCRLCGQCDYIMWYIVVFFKSVFICFYQADHCRLRGQCDLHGTLHLHSISLDNSWTKHSFNLPGQ